MSHIFSLQPWVVAGLWGTVLVYALCVGLEADRAARWIERIVLAAALLVVTLVLNDAFIGLSAKDLLNNRLLYPVYDWYRFG